jgi:DNA glycosylase AlkZ-like
VFRESAWISPVVLVGGQVAGLWELERTKDRVVVRVEPFGSLPVGARKIVRDEADRIGDFLWLEAETRFEPVTFLKRAADRKRPA